ncbi:hypothetical protein NT01EI_1778 [Edwardsiella ictaluri 93-146]|uniref:Uncharacterized protein n=1 Tax=Edwardsiella ictaluri (strain 93-146) TaxID=634503 RepID=C5BFJ4_EDWI9|nr:hypothetical protein NT01EI_1778 [Edwardsiella ictaluri 93-146]
MVLSGVGWRSGKSDDPLIPCAGLLGTMNFRRCSTCDGLP